VSTTGGDSLNSSRLTLIAHAGTEAQKRAAFPLDEPISGWETAKSQASRWTVPRAEHIWSAPEQRAQQTYRMLGLHAVLADELQDCDYGRWCGRKMEDIQVQEPDNIVTWLTDPSVAPHGGESIENLINRIGSWMSKQCDVKSTIAVTHPAVIRAAIVYALRIPTQLFWRFDVSPLSVTDLRFSGNLWTLRSSGCSLRVLDRPDG
jgi:broad specificity phosphatase PhoE